MFKRSESDERDIAAMIQRHAETELGVGGKGGGRES